MRGIGLGALLGVAHGITMRAWMRWISDEPEFSWSGTIFIVGAFTVAFAAAGLVHGGRARGWRGLLVPARAAAIVLSLPCFVGAGGFMLPTIVLGCLALARTDWPRSVRVGLGTLSTLMVGPVVLQLGGIGWIRSVTGAITYGLLAAFEIRVLAEPYRPTVGRLGRVGRWIAGAAAAAVIGGVALMTAGLATGG